MADSPSYTYELGGETEAERNASEARDDEIGENPYGSGTEDEGEGESGGGESGVTGDTVPSPEQPGALKRKLQPYRIDPANSLLESMLQGLIGEVAAEAKAAAEAAAVKKATAEAEAEAEAEAAAYAAEAADAEAEAADGEVAAADAEAGGAVEEWPNLSPDERDVILEVHSELDKLVGLHGVKEEVEDLILHVIRGKRIGEVALLDGLHIALYGNSGVGKTTVAKVLRNALYGLGVRTGPFVEASPNKLKEDGLKKTMSEAEGGVLFVDEAYGLLNCRALNTQLTGAISTSEGSVTVVVAGYTDKMNAWLNTNPRLKACFRYFNLPDYSADELYEIAKRELASKDWELSGDAARAALRNAAEFVANHPVEHRNARGVKGRNGLLPLAFQAADARMSRGSRRQENAQLLTEADIEKARLKLEHQILLTNAPKPSTSNATAAASQSGGSGGGSGGGGGAGLPIFNR
jgi:uncharacterized membrane protein YgcG